MISKDTDMVFSILIVTDIKELNGQTFEDITPEDSTENDEDENYDEDDEYDDDESNGVGFGLQYNLPPQTQGKHC